MKGVSRFVCIAVSLTPSLFELLNLLDEGFERQALVLSHEPERLSQLGNVFCQDFDLQPQPDTGMLDSEDLQRRQES